MVFMCERHYINMVTYIKINPCKYALICILSGDFCLIV